MVAPVTPQRKRLRPLARGVAESISLLKNQFDGLGEIGIRG
jgi:hypothetical protein